MPSFSLILSWLLIGSKSTRKMKAIVHRLSELCRHTEESNNIIGFGTLYALNDPEVDNNEIEMLHESLLTADPSGMEGRPGLAPEKQ